MSDFTATGQLKLNFGFGLNFTANKDVAINILNQALLDAGVSQTCILIGLTYIGLFYNARLKIPDSYVTRPFHKMIENFTAGLVFLTVTVPTIIIAVCVLYMISLLKKQKK